MTLENTRQVIDIVTGTGDATTAQVNDLLKEGWTLIGFYVQKGDALVAGIAKPHFVLAWQKGEPPPDPQSSWLSERLKEELASVLGLGLSSDNLNRLVGGISNGGAATMALALSIVMAISSIEVTEGGNKKELDGCLE